MNEQEQAIKAYMQAVEDLQIELKRFHCSLGHVMPYLNKTADEIDEITEMLVGVTEELRNIKEDTREGLGYYPTQAHGSIPSFNNYKEEAEYWDTHDMADFEEIEEDEVSDE